MNGDGPSGQAPAPPEADPVLVELFSRLARPFDPATAVAALTGLSPAVVDHLAGVSLALSPEAGDLLHAMPTIVRSLATSVKSHHERCIGQLRGPVLWSETMSARASSFGDPDLFVCATPSRAYDIDENQVLVAALHAVADAGHAAMGTHAEARLDPRARDAGRIGAEADRWIAHPSLLPVGRVRPSARSIRRTRAGKHERTYRPALRLLERAAEPLQPEEVDPWLAPRARDQQRLLVALVGRLETTTGRRIPPLRAERGALQGGPLQFRAGPRGEPTPSSGLLVGRLLVDVPSGRGLDRAGEEAALRDRAEGREAMVVHDDADLDAVLERAVTLARTA